jgi:hypothetical protein
MDPISLKLYEALKGRLFDLDDLRELTETIGIDWDVLSGTNKPTKALALVRHCEKIDTVGVLLAKVRELRPQLHDALDSTDVILSLAGDEINRQLEIARLIRLELAAAQPVQSDRKQQIEAYLNGIAQTLEDCVPVLKQRCVPHGKCGELQFHAQNLSGMVGDLIGPTRADAFKQQLIAAHEIEIFGAHHFNLPQSEMDAVFDQLLYAAGYFRAAGSSLKVDSDSG